MIATRTAAAVLGFVLVPVLMCAGLLALFHKTDEQMPFDEVGWRGPRYDANGFFTGIRLKMVDDLLRQHDFHGWTITELEALLGEADIYERDGQKRYVKYDLRDGLNLLVFETDEQEVVLEYQVIRDD